MLVRGTTFGVDKSLLEEGIFSITATPLGPSLCLLEESSDGELDLLLKEGEVWRKKWFSEVKDWNHKDVKCFRAAKVSLYGVPCHMRNKIFLDVVLEEVGMCPTLDFLNHSPSRYDVLTLMLFTGCLDTIRRKVTVCLDGIWITILIIEEAVVALEEKDSSSSSGSTNSSAMDVFFDSEPEDNGEVEPSVVGMPALSSQENRKKEVGQVDLGCFNNQKMLNVVGLDMGPSSGPSIFPKRTISLVIGHVTEEQFVEKRSLGKTETQAQQAVIGKPQQIPGETLPKEKNSKKVRKKMHELFNLGEKAEKFDFPMELLRKEGGRNSSGDLSLLENYKNNDCLLSGNSLTYSDIMNYNNRIEKGSLGNMSVGLWNSMNRIGIINVSEAFDPISKIKELEGKGCEGEVREKEFIRSYP